MGVQPIEDVIPEEDVIVAFGDVDVKRVRPGDWSKGVRDFGGIYGRDRRETEAFVLQVLNQRR